MCGCGMSLELCGVSVQYPWRRLILAGVKAVEVRKYPLGRYPVSLRDKIHFSSRLLAGVPRRMLTEASTSAHRLKRLASLAWFGSAAVFSLLWRSLTSFGTRLESHRVAGTIGFIWVTVPSSAGGGQHEDSGTHACRLEDNARLAASTFLDCELPRCVASSLRELDTQFMDLCKSYVLAWVLWILHVRSVMERRAIFLSCSPGA